MDSTSHRPSPVGLPSRGAIIVISCVVPIVMAILLGAFVGFLVSQGGCSSRCQTKESLYFDTTHNRTLMFTSRAPGVFDPLSGDEMEQVESVLIYKGIIDSRDSTINFSSAYITSMTIFPPSKEKVLLYLRDRTYLVGRVAEVHVIGKTNIYILHVGPLHEKPVSVTVVDTLPLEYRHVDEFLIEEMEKVLHPILVHLSGLLTDSFDEAKYPEDLAINFNTGHNLQTSQGREIRFSLHFRGLDNIDQNLFDVLPFSGILVFKGVTSSDWRVKELFYANQGPYVTATDLLSDYNGGKIRKIVLPKGYRKDLFNRLFPESKGERQGSNLPPPTSYSSDARYDIDRYNVNWLGWSFSISNNPMRGLSIFNCHFKDVSVLYELSLQDILVKYVSDTHGQSNSVYLLSAFSIGAYDGVLLGVDCPTRATLLNTTYWNTQQRKGVTTRSICVFEANGELPLWRRSGNRFASGLNDNYLVVRATTRIFNLEYIVEYMFYLDGSIKTNIHNFGSLQGAFWDTNKKSLISPEDKRNAFGYRLSDYVGGIAGSHSFNFKVDLDVGQQYNFFEELTWKTGNVMTALRSFKYVKELPNYFVTNVTQYPQHKQILIETGFLRTTPHQVWLVSAGHDSHSYRVVVDTSLTRIIHPDHPAASLASFTNYDLVVLYRQSDEPYFTTAYDLNDLQNSRAGIENILMPRQNIVDRDIVLSVNTGFMELPHSEDNPVQRRQTATFRLLPFNVFPGSPDLDLPFNLRTQDNSVSQTSPQQQACDNTQT